MGRLIAGKFDRLINIACASLFVLFAFVYLYEYQADLLTVMQHVFSEGQTHYDALVGAVVITAVLMLLQLGVARLCRAARLAASLTFVPSALLLTLLTSLHFTGDGACTTHGWIVAVPLLLVVYALLVWASYATHFSEYMAERMDSPLRSLWMNLGIMSLLMLFACLSGNGDREYHSRIHMEQCISHSDYNGALDVAKRYDAPDSCMTMLVAYTLSKQNALGERLFEYRLAGRSAALLPDGKNVRLELLPEDRMYQYLGAWFVQRMPARKYLDFLRRHNMLNKVSADYLLCACLLDKDLNAFVENIGKHYAIDKNLPKHYKEALLLYMHLNSAPKVVYGNSVMEADFQDFQNMGNTYENARERKNMVRGTYGNTYWFYYEYE